MMLMGYLGGPVHPAAATWEPRARKHTKKKYLRVTSWGLRDAVELDDHLVVLQGVRFPKTQHFFL